MAATGLYIKPVISENPPGLEDTSSVKEVLLIFVSFLNHRLLCVCSLKINLTDLQIFVT